MADRKRIAIRVTGIVQGVGFRPFVHRCAEQFSVCGWARNTSLGVEMELEGEADSLSAFVRELKTSPPPLAVIQEVTESELSELCGYTAFEIRQSVEGIHDTLVSPDAGTCPACLRELRDPKNRRYRFPFINCTNCGPRFTITKTVPYDRQNTTMAGFSMCPECAAEYGDISDRRYHAQPDCCPVCGPRLWFAAADGEEQSGDAIIQGQKLLKSGGILAIKGLGGFHLACMADDAQTVRRLRQRKHRDAKPFALMCPDAASAEKLCFLSDKEQEVLESSRRPIVLLKKRPETNLPEISDNGYIGIMLPYTPLHYLLFEHPRETGNDEPFFSALVMTSANLSDCPVITENAAAIEQLAGIADGFLLHDRKIETRCDDSLIRVLDGREYPLRRSRGYAPQPIFTHFDTSGILALGAEQKASFAIGKERTLFYSQHIGDLKNAETLEHYETQIAHFERLFGVTPKRLVCDMHPDYLSTIYARGRAEKEALPLLQVQHHWAHFASCMADNNLSEKCIGLVWDGTGMGDDNTIWGGETLYGDYNSFARLSSIRPVRLAGGDTAVKQIGRIGLAMALDAGISDSALLPETEQALVKQMLAADVNCPKSSGMGRLFDGTYALLTGAAAAGYEGQGAVLLETLAMHAPNETDAFSTVFYQDENAVIRLDTRPLLRQLWEQKKAGVSIETLAMRFHNTLVRAGIQMCLAAKERTGCKRAVLSGGVFQNAVLMATLPRVLRDNGFLVYHHGRAATNDEGIALGQAAIAAYTQQ